MDSGPVTLDGVAQRRPVLEAGRCVHARIQTAACRACVEVCPRGAWRLDDAALTLEAAACDGCGLCLPACPPQAIHLDWRPARLEVAGQVVLAACCDVAAQAAHEASPLAALQGPGRIGCLHAIGLAKLLEAYRAGLRVWLLARGVCLDCVRGRAPSLFERIAHLNQALGERGLPPLLLREVSPQALTRLPAAADNARRDFLRGLSPAPEPEPRWFPPGDDGLLPWSPRLDPSRCVGCDACVRICPEAALRLGPSAYEANAYEVEARACTGCGLCRDVCPVQAVTLAAWQAPGLRRLDLTEHRCVACDARFHTPAGAKDRSELCWVCRQRATLSGVQPRPRCGVVVQSG